MVAVPRLFCRTQRPGCWGGAGSRGRAAPRDPSRTPMAPAPWSPWAAGSSSTPSIPAPGTCPSTHPSPSPAPIFQAHAGSGRTVQSGGSGPRGGGGGGRLAAPWCPAWPALGPGCVRLGFKACRQGGGSRAGARALLIPAVGNEPHPGRARPPQQHPGRSPGAGGTGRTGRLLCCSPRGTRPRGTRARLGTRGAHPQPLAALAQPSAGDGPLQASGPLLLPRPRSRVRCWRRGGRCPGHRARGARGRRAPSTQRTWAGVG